MRFSGHVRDATGPEARLFCGKSACLGGCYFAVRLERFPTGESRWPRHGRHWFGLASGPALRASTPGEPTHDPSSRRCACHTFLDISARACSAENAAAHTGAGKVVCGCEQNRARLQQSIASDLARSREAFALDARRCTLARRSFNARPQPRERRSNSPLRCRVACATQRNFRLAAQAKDVACCLTRCAVAFAPRPVM